MKRLLAFVLLCGPLGVAQAQLKSATLPELDVPALQAMARSVRSIRAEPNRITMHVGQTMKLDAITIIVVDSAGKDRGRTKNFDFGIPPGSAANAVPRTITAVRVGTAELTIHYPKAAWKARADPRVGATVKIDIKP